MSLSTMFNIDSLNEAFYPVKLLLYVTKLTEKGKILELEPSISSGSIATFILDFLEILVVIYFI